MTIHGTSLTMMSNVPAKNAKLNFTKKAKDEDGSVIQLSPQSKFDKMIENIQEQIQKVNENERYDEETKKTKIEELQKQLEELEKEKASQLSESLLGKEKKAEKNAANNNSVTNTQKNADGDTLELSLNAKALVQADSKLKNLESAHSTKVKSEGAARVLASEIEIDKERGVDTARKEEQLAELKATAENSAAGMDEVMQNINNVYDHGEPVPKPEKEEVSHTAADTGKVDGEIKRLKDEKQQLEQQMNSVRNDPEKLRELEKQLSQVTSELSQKDTDAYRKANTSFTSV